MSDSKRRCVERSRDPDVWLRWYEELSSGEESPLDENEEDEEEKNENIVERSDHETDSEIEFSSDLNKSPSESDGEQTDNGGSKFYIGKDKTTKWRKECGNVQVRTRAHNNITHLPGSKGDARNAMLAIDCIKLFVSDAIIRILVCSTNIYILRT
ncbi:unnamed protein product [Acanthoscelides obtectus]|uniref:Uncharacterized protein n=1 Tax=Acanthoscelides obtectus TaxID=200917 RepID=A0A9P0KE58_ACAOB|nr:unnamed protein product [Acanthoscelides obtectus]CAK1635223.1 hypothetical protein AOBTE_LOCUS9140 [Acanthoscelides obtectus]